MKIVHYTTLLSRAGGGVPVALSGLANAMAEAGADITIVGGADADFANDKPLWGDLNVVPHAIKGRYGLDLKVFKDIAALKPDILHVHGIWTAASIYGAASALSGVPVVVSPHGMLDPWILSRSKPIKAIHAALFERPMLRRAHVHALNENERIAVGNFLPSLRDRTFVLPNGVTKLGAVADAENRQNVLYIGRLHPKKQVLELASHWAASESLRPYHLTIAGLGDAKYEGAVTDLVSTAPGIDFVGPLYGDDKVRAMRAAKFLVLPSLSEGLPMTVLEALQHGCIPIITDECNLQEVVDDGIGLRIASDFSDFEAVVADALSWSDEIFAARSRAAQEYASRYQWDNIARAMMAHYQDMISSRVRKPARV